MQTSQHLDLFFTYREGFTINSGNKNPIAFDEDSSYSEQPTTTRIVFDPV